MSFVERLDVPDAKSSISTSPVVSPRVAASKAIPAAVIPPPIIRTSNSFIHISFKYVILSNAENGDFLLIFLIPFTEPCRVESYYIYKENSPIGEPREDRGVVMSVYFVE